MLISILLFSFQFYYLLSIYVLPNPGLHVINYTFPAFSVKYGNIFHIYPTWPIRVQLEVQGVQVPVAHAKEQWTCLELWRIFKKGTMVWSRGAKAVKMKQGLWLQVNKAAHVVRSSKVFETCLPVTRLHREASHLACHLQNGRKACMSQSKRGLTNSFAWWIVLM